MKLRAGQVLKRYRIDRLLRTSEITGTWLANHVQLGHPVAIQVPSEEMGPAGFVRMQESARRLAVLSSDSIASVLDFWLEAEEIPIVVWEHAQGETLRQVLDRQDGCLPWPTAVEVATRLLFALHQLHETGCAHRCLRPDNIVIIPFEDQHIKLVDLCCTAPFGEPDRVAEQRAETLGNHLYLSPEQLDGHPIEASSDVYTASLILYEMLAGQPPEGWGADLGTLAIRKTSAPPPPQGPPHLPAVPPELERVICGALVPSIERRPASARDFARALRLLSRTVLPADPV